MTPTARSIKKLRDDGYFVDTVERWMRFPDKNKKSCSTCKRPYMIQMRKDYCGFADLIAFKPGVGFLAIQATDDTNVSHRVAKIKDMEAVHGFIAAGGVVSVHGWGKKGAKCKRKTYQLREVFIGKSNSLFSQKLSPLMQPPQCATTKPDAFLSEQSDQASLSFQ